ncbi:MAG: hypothetical protein KJP18_00345 [Gemmatimonadetes bacterium]|nr:hypothetical protein [Gemmatimonadota bacterium]
MSESLFQDPMSVAGLLAGTVALIFWLPGIPVAGYVLAIYGALAAAWLLGQVGGA